MAQARAAHWITLEAAAAKLGWSYHTTRNWVLKRKLRGKRLLPLDRWVVDAADVEPPSRLARGNARRYACPRTGATMVPLRDS